MPDVLTKNPLRALLAERRVLVMGILNVTPDSFSDGGQFFDPEVAIAHARDMAQQGADILDIGAESTRPYGGRKPVSLEDELDRLKPVLSAVLAFGLPISIDTIKAKVADWALRQGAAILNDVWGLQRDADMARVAAEHGVPVIVMHNREAADPTIDIMADVKAFFARSLEIAARAGIAREQIVLDPGIGFGKTPAQSILMIARLAAARSPAMCWPCSTAPTSCECMMSAKPSRRYASWRQFGRRKGRAGWLRRCLDLAAMSATCVPR
jgi:dihydropteroate synthase